VTTLAYADPMTERGSAALRRWEPVLIVGTGLIGTSVGLALARAGVTAQLADSNRGAAQVAAVRGAGIGRQEGTSPGLVVVATPPDHLADEIVAALSAYPDAIVTDVGSIKAGPLTSVRDQVPAAQAARYVGGHPMAGSERSGPLAAAADIFDGRSWAVTPAAGADPAAIEAVEALAGICGASVVRMDAVEHDQAVARMSHLPHLMAALTAARLPGTPATHLQLGGQGIRDVTRIAASDPALWRQIVLANADPLHDLLRQLRDQLDDLVDALDDDRPGPLDALLASGVAGAALIPGKHNAPAEVLATVTVHVPDRPGELAALFAAAGKASVNIEDLRIDHDPGRDYGLVEIDVNEARADDLVEALASGGWSAHR
jgi:prephenate dehydrogenase